MDMPASAVVILLRLLLNPIFLRKFSSEKRLALIWIDVSHERTLINYRRVQYYPTQAAEIF